MINILIYLLICVSTAALLRWKAKLPNEVFRKTLHIIVLGLYAIWLFSFDDYKTDIVSMIVSVLCIFPILLLLDRNPRFTRLINGREPGELPSSLLLAGLSFVMVTALMWGGLNDRFLALASFYSWGLGDAAAALVGKRFGKIKIGPDKKKSLEGSIAMFVFASLGIFIALLIRQTIWNWPTVLMIFAAAALCTLVELYSPKGSDTITCSFTTAMVITAFYLNGGIINVG
jgi:dolichol kinase